MFSKHNVISELLPDVYLLEAPKFNDIRGCFVKTHTAAIFSSIHPEFTIEENFISYSVKDVLRGVHFQIEESAHYKTVYCALGHILDVVVDIRRNSPCFNKPVSVNMSEDDNKLLLIGKGYGHAFLSQSDQSLVMYSTSTIYSPKNDKGVLWSSIDFDWPIENPILSTRDQEHISIHDQNYKFV